MAASDLTVMGNDLGRMAQAIELSRRTLAIIKTNLFNSLRLRRVVWATLEDP